ncbi:MAG: hypothetical protein Q9187_002064 [Circinaria calcarea]
MPNFKAWLVLIGIDFYPESANRLRGGVNDVNEIEITLQNRYKDLEIIKLVASVTGDSAQVEPPEPKGIWPTWENVTTALKQITTKASSGDVVHIHYSGHGTLKPTRDSELAYMEHYEMDAALVLLDRHARFRIRYLRGVELARLLDDMVQSGLSLTMVVDACHSGSISRNDSNTVRSIPWNAEVDAEFPLQASMLTMSADSNCDTLRDSISKSHWLLNPRGYALITACGPHEVAKEIEASRGKHHGGLSYHILEALEFYLRNQIVEITYDLIYRRACARMYTKIPAQNPILLGNQAAVFMGSKAAIKNSGSACEVIKVLDNRQLWLNAGLIHGVCVGDEYEVCTVEGAKEQVSKVVITDVQAAHSVAERIVAKTPKEDCPQIKLGCSAALTVLAKPRAHVKLYPEAENTLNQMVEQNMWLHELPVDELIPFDVPCFSVTLTNNQFGILDYKDQKIPNLPRMERVNAEAEKGVVTILEHLAKFAFVQALDNRNVNALSESNFSIGVQAKNNPSNVLKENFIEVQDQEKIVITFQNNTNGVLYFTLLNLMPLKQIRRIYPRSKECETVCTQDALPKNTSEAITTSGTIRLLPRMKVPQRIKESGGVQADDILKFIVSTSPVRRVSSIELPDLWNQVKTRGDSSAEKFGTLVQESFTENKGRLSPSKSEEAPVKWACRNISIRTVIKN